MNNVIDCYGILGVNTDASPEEIEDAYKNIRIAFGDEFKGNKEFAKRKLEEAHKAHITLSDPRFRYIYDENCGIKKR